MTVHFIKKNLVSMIVNKLLYIGDVHCMLCVVYVSVSCVMYTKDVR